eukprot:CAMPEP_0183732984 /NCGR_PEP_ID=MMETSP0737-20130205/39863_1 /TAXON_ID=385413 /ORGANISM="Thalassiosira miniscula, Strain CCMP1093" /LENGTH=667 /DNA_ID=CAMNT_0025966143 /DNA_START=20 /DNA_END=2024 /DNA_ORIENTATION=+
MRATSKAAEAARPEPEWVLIESTFITALFSLAHAAVVADGITDTTVVGYYGPHRFYGRNGLTKPENMDFTKLTRINYGPFQINEHGSIWGTDNADSEILFGPRDWNAPAHAPTYCHRTSPDTQMQCGHYHYEDGLLHGAHKNDVEVYLVVGGPNSSNKFSEMSADPEARAEFAQNVRSNIANYEFDGVDISWQFPESLEDMSNLGSLLSEVRTALNEEGLDHEKHFGITATVPCNHENMENMDIRLLNSVLSEFNLLSFDFHTSQDNKVGPNSALYDSIDGEGDSVNSCVMKYLEGGASKSKINIGLAFYGHSFQGGTYFGDDCKVNWAGVCSDTQSWQEDDGSPQYYNIYKKMPGMALSFDLQTMTPLASNDQSVVSFDDPRSICLKTEYVISNELNGVFIKDLASDMLDDKSTPLLDALTLKLLKPAFNCGGNEFEKLFEWREVVKPNPLANTAIDTSSESDASSSKIELEYRYTCGIGQGNARDRCNSPDLEDLSCNTGICPTNMVCFVVPCAKKVQDHPVEASFSKRKPKPKRKPRQKPVVDDRPPSDEVNNQPASQGEVTVTNTAPNMSFSCGDNIHHAKSCRTPCPNGISDCPSGQFCFWLKCEASTSVSSDPPIEIPVAQTELKYQCGETRADALTCSEDCGAGWQCPGGKDCYSVPCPL